jgi:hypothetical protein
MQAPGASSSAAQLLPAAAQAVAARFSELLNAGVAAAQAALLQRDADGVARFAAAPPLVRDAAQGGAGLRAALSRQLASLQEEEAHWEGLRATYVKAPAAAVGADAGGAEAEAPAQQGGAEAQPSQPAAADATAGEAAPAGAQGPGTQAAAEGDADGPATAAAPNNAGSSTYVSQLAGVRTETAARMSGQVEALCGVLSRVELLVGRAERVAGLMQVRAAQRLPPASSHAHAHTPANLHARCMFLAQRRATCSEYHPARLLSLLVLMCRPSSCAPRP